MRNSSKEQVARAFYKFFVVAALSAIVSACGGGSTDGNVLTTADNDEAVNEPGGSETLNGTDCAQSLGSGELGASFTLINTASACDYYLQGEVILRGELIIEAGTTIIAGIDSVIRINGGSLIAVGTSSNPIVFEGEVNSKGFWKGIALTKTRPSRLEHVVIKDAGQVAESRFEPHAALDIFGSTLSLVNVEVSNSFVNGVSFVNGSVITEFASNSFYGNSLAGLTLSPYLVAQLDTASDYIGETIANGNPVVEIHDQDVIGQKPIDNATWKELNAPYTVLSQLGLTEAREQLTLEPGVQITTKEENYPPIYIYNGGRLTALGTAEKPITFTAGTTDIDRHSIDISTDGEAEFNHVIIDGYDNGIVVGGGTVSISNTELNVGKGYGINCGNSASRDTILNLGEGVTVSDNAEALLSPTC